MDSASTTLLPDPPSRGEPVADGTPRAEAIVAANGRLRAASASFASTVRTRRDELFTGPLTTLVRPQDRPALAHAIEAVASLDWPGCALEVAFLQHTGEDLPIRLELEPEAPNAVRMRATDLSAERVAARTLVEQVEALRALTEHSLDIWVLISDIGKLQLVSASIAAHLGWTVPELEGKTLFELLHPEDVPVIRSLLRTLKEDPASVHHAVLRARHRDGGWRTLESTTSGFNPRLLGNAVFIVNARDITTRERTEAALREVEYRYSQLISQALTGIVVVRDGRIIYANPRFLDITGLTADALAKRPRVASLVDKSAIAAIRRVRADLAMGLEQATRVLVSGRHAAGHEIVVDVATSVVEFEGLPALLCTVTDMTESRALQARMAEAEKVEAVGLLAGGVAHDFNNLVTSILAWVDLAGEELGPGTATEPLDEIRGAAQRAADLTRQLLAFGRRQRLDPRPLDLGEVVVRLKRWLDRVLGAKHTLEVSVPDAPWLVVADRAEIERALTSLIMNAKDAMRAGGTIRVEVTHDTVSADRAASLGPLKGGEHVVVVVRDSGVGMEERVRRRIFEPFFTTKPHGEGTGLGLAAVQGTVLQSGGAIEVTSRPGVGTEFRCYFPRLSHAADTDADRGATRPPHASTARRILLIEDDPQVGSVMRRLLQEQGHDVQLATTPADARAIAAARASDVIVCDLGLPGMRGSLLAGELRAKGAARGIILISGREITEAERDEAGARAILLHKPFRPQRLLDAVIECLRVVDAPR